MDKSVFTLCVFVGSSVACRHVLFGFAMKGQSHGEVVGSVRGEVSCSASED